MHAVLTGAVVGLAVIVWTTFSSRWLTGDLAWLKSPFHPFMTSVVGTLTILLVGLLVTAATRRARRNSE